MPIKQYKPTTPGRRLSSVDTFSDITKVEPEKSLTFFRKQKSGRSVQQGRITVRHRGGGARRYTRVVDFRGDKFDQPAKVLAIEYDPGRGARLALVQYADAEKRYLVAPIDLKVGDTVMSSKQQIEIQVGNRLPLKFIPVGLMIHNIEVKPGQGGVLVRGAGTGAQIMAWENKMVTLRLPSSEVRLVSEDCLATIGQVGNPDHNLVRWGKAGRTRHRGFRPTVRGKAMNPVDHPHGGGEGRNPIGLKSPKTPQGKPALGVKTRDPKKWSTTFIVSRRHKHNKHK